MKKLLMALVLLVGLFAFTACDNDNGTEETQPTVTVAETGADEEEGTETTEANDVEVETTEATE